MSRNPHARRPLKVESLESRAMLAGDVAASVSQGMARIQGDSQANEISVTDLGGGQLEVVGLNGTTVNGQSTPVVVNGAQGAIKISLKDGNDKIAYQGTDQHTVSRLSIESGNGDDVVSVDKVFATLLKVETGSGSDTVNAMDITGTRASIETGDGDDIVSIGDSSIRPDATIEVSRLSIETGLGTDRVQINDAIINAAYAEVETGDGDDLISIRDLQAEGSFKVESDKGTDAVAITDSVFSQLTIELGEGDNDSVSLTNVLSTKTKLNGGLGTGDSLSQVNSNLGTLKLKNFESIV